MGEGHLHACNINAEEILGDFKAFSVMGMLWAGRACSQELQKEGRDIYGSESVMTGCLAPGRW